MLDKSTSHIVHLVGEYSPLDYATLTPHGFCRGFCGFGLVWCGIRGVRHQHGTHKKSCTLSVQDAASGLRFLVMCPGKDEEYDCYPRGIDDELRHGYFRCFPSTNDPPHNMRTMTRMPM